MEGILQPILFALSGPHLNLNPVGRLGVPPSMRGFIPMPAIGLTLSGVSRDSTGAALPGCTCTLFRVCKSATDANGVAGNEIFIQAGVTTSDGSGNYSFVVGFDGPYRVTFDLAGAPTRAGLTLKTLAGA